MKETQHVGRDLPGPATPSRVIPYDRHMSEIETSPLLTVNEAAVFLRTTPKAIYTMIARQQLPGVTRIGRRVLVCRDALLEWLERKRAPSPGE